MVTIGSLWLAIVLSAIFVHIVSAIAWTVAPHHKSDFKPIPNQDEFRAHLRGYDLAPGEYWFPFSTDHKEMASPEMAAKMEEGPVGFLTVKGAGKPNMGKMMVQSLVHFLAVSFVVAYVVTRTVPPDAEYLSVFRVAGTTAFIAHAGALFPAAIWFGVPWGRTWKTVLDALLYALVTAGTFGWLWG